jgi:hypothetical protein
MKPYVILFSGHMIDTAKRETPRFPKEKEGRVRQEIKTKVLEILNTIFKKDHFSEEELRSVMGVAGGACGGDILFHEVCQELSIPSQVLLALPPEKFIAKSVRPGGNSWVDRFNALDADPNISFHIFSESEKLPNWLQSKNSLADFWERNNLWILHTALAMSDRNLSFIAVWDGKKGDGPGGTENMIREVEKNGAKSFIINPLKLKGS